MCKYYNLIRIISIPLMVVAALSTPAAFIYLVYEWASNDIELKFALWSAVKFWLAGMGIGATGVLTWFLSYSMEGAYEGK